MNSRLDIPLPKLIVYSSPLTSMVGSTDKNVSGVVCLIIGALDEPVATGLADMTTVDGMTDVGIDVGNEVGKLVMGPIVGTVSTLAYPCIKAREGTGCDHHITVQCLIGHIGDCKLDRIPLAWKCCSPCDHFRRESIGLDQWVLNTSNVGIVPTKVFQIPNCIGNSCC